MSDRDKTLDQEAREAAEGFADSVDAETGRTICKGSYMNGYLAAATARDKEIEELRARVAELEGLVPRWVADAEHTRLLALGWQCGPDVIWHRSPGMIEAEWHWLMVPPIQLPEGE